MEIIRLENIVKNYRLGNIVVNALRSVSLSVNKNEYVALMGPSGSGKSTLMNILGCLDTPTSGKFILNDKVVSDLSDDELAEIRNKEIGFVFQSFNLLPRYSALQNIMLPLIYAGVNKNDRIAKGMNALKEVQLSDRATHKPNELSGGEKQRIAIARAVINNPSIILADEPTGNLDSKTSLEIMGIFNQIHLAGNTILIVTHDESVARFAHRIIKLMDGKIVSDEINDNIRQSTADNN